MTPHAPTVGIIGLGFGRAHIPAFQVNSCRVVALCQRDQPSAKTVADRYGVEHIFGRWEQMLETAKPEIGMTATPANLHRAIASRSLVHLVDMVRWTFGEFTRVAAHAGIAYPSRSAPGVSRPPDTEDYCTVVGELTSGAQVTLTASRAAHGVNEHTLEAFGTRGAVSYRLSRERAHWWEGELRAGAGAALTPVTPRTPLPTVAADGDPLDVTGRTLIAPLVGRLLEGIRTGTTPSPSLADGMRAQAVLDATLEAAARGAWVEVAR